MTNNLSIVYRPIGYVENGYVEPISPEVFQEEESRIIVDLEFVEGLFGMNPGQKIIVIFHFHLAEDYDLLQHPRGDADRPLRGVFTLRSPRRPNPIGMTEVELISIKGNVLHVHSLDAINGSPVLDIKPAID